MCINSIKYSGELGLLFAYYLFISPKSIKHLKSLHVLGNTYPVDICLQYPATLTMPPCAYTFPVDTCAKNTFLLDTSKCKLKLKSLPQWEWIFGNV